MGFDKRLSVKAGFTGRAADARTAEQELDDFLDVAGTEDGESGAKGDDREGY